MPDHQPLVPLIGLAAIVGLAVMFSFAGRGEVHADDPDPGDGEAKGHRVVNLAAVCLLDDEDHRTAEHALRWIERAASRQQRDLIVAPYMPFLSFGAGRGAADAALEPFAALADRYDTYVALAMNETDGQRTYATSVLLDRDGHLAFKSRKTHALPDDTVDLGDTLEVYATDFGTIGATIGTDFYFPEVYEVLRMKGAEVLLWHHYPERFREHSGWDALLRARAFDSHAHLIAAHYADPRPYITNRHDIGMQGAAYGRSTILNRVGIPIADTGYEHGIADATVDLDFRKQDPYAGWRKDENVFYVNVLAERDAFVPVAEPWQPPELPRFEKRTARIAVVHTDRFGMWRNERAPDRLLELLDEAAKYEPDLVLASEQAAQDTDATTREYLEQIGRRAKRMNAWVCIGGVGDERFNSIARIWNRDGEQVFAQPIFWPKGFRELTYIDTDFARISTHTCGDLYAPFFDRTLALAGVELILDPSQMWGPDGRTNETLLRARALDNAAWIACAHWNTSDPGLRSVVVDPYGQVVAGSAFQTDGVIACDIDFSKKRVYYAGRADEQPTRGGSDIASYYSEDLPEQRTGWRRMIFERRRPALYGPIPTTNEVIMRYRPEKSPRE